MYEEEKPMTWKQRLYGWGAIILILLAMFGTMSAIAGCNPDAQKGAFLAGCPCACCF